MILTTKIGGYLNIAISICLAFILAFCVRQKAHGEDIKELKIASSQRYSTLDPQLGYDWLTYQTIHSICANLTTASDTAADYELDLAESMEIHDGGRRITFELLPNQVFHNGQTVTADDVVYSFNRLLSPELNSPGASMFSNIIGYEDYRDGKTTEIFGVKSTGQRGVEIRLKNPQASIFMVLATNFGCVFPKGHNPKKFDFPISAGPLRIVDFIDNRELKLVRFEPATHRYGPVFDRYNIHSDMKSSEILAQYANKEIDIILDGLQWETISSVHHNPSVQIEEGLHSTTYITLNINLPPFDKVEVRQAVNFAIDRENLANILKGSVRPTTQIAPPSFPEFVKGKQKYVHSPEKALELLKQSVELPVEVNLYAINEPLHKELVFSIVSDLARVGINVSPHFGNHQDILDLASTKAGVQMVFSGGLGWIADYNDVSNFYFPLFTEDAAGDGGWNWSHYINKDLEQKALFAESKFDPTMRLERRDIWREIFDEIESDAAWVPLYNRSSIHIISASALEFVLANKPETSSNIHYIFKRK